uniref:Uncharacterized protein n=1 Tax=Eptatretus burgeri TaxID=7764 RepID=A0A8C4QQA6_EPTBU
MRNLLRSGSVNLWLVMLVIGSVVVGNGKQFLSTNDCSWTGGSHFLLMEKVAGILAKRGHRVTLFLNYSKERAPYRLITWTAGDTYLKTFQDWFQRNLLEFLHGRCFHKPFSSQPSSIYSFIILILLLLNYFSI